MASATHEATLIERADGSLLMLMHNQHPSGKVATTVSTDGGETWSDVSFAQEITEIFCQPNAVPWPTEDGGRTWIASRTFNPAYYVYQCMTILPDGTLGLLWEREMQGLYFTRIPLEWLEPPRSDDSSYLDTRPPATLTTQEDGRRHCTPRVFNTQGGYPPVPALHA